MQKLQKRATLGVVERFAIAMGFLVLSLVITQTIFALCLTFGVLLYLFSQKISWRKLLRFLRIPLIFALFGLLSILLVLSVDEPNTLFVVSKKHIPLSVTEESLKNGEVVLWRALNSLLSLYILIATTTAKEKNALADKLHIPVSLVELGVLSFRYIQLLKKKKCEIQTAQCLRLGYVSYQKSFRSLVLLLSSVFIYSVSVFRMNYQALLTRGYSGKLYYSNAEDVPKDRCWFVIFVAFCVVGCLALYKIFLR